MQPPPPSPGPFCQASHITTTLLGPFSLFLMYLRFIVTDPVYKIVTGLGCDFMLFLIGMVLQVSRSGLHIFSAILESIALRHHLVSPLISRDFDPGGHRPVTF